MPTCLICHMDIGDDGKGVEKSYRCPNGHPVHETCLAEWSIHSPKCPLCDRDYDSYIMAKIKTYLEQKEKEKDESSEDKLLEQRKARIKQAAEKMVFLKQIDAITNLLEKQEYDKALEKLNIFDSQDLTKDNRHRILFLRGKTYYLKGRYDMAIGHLFKLTKEDFDFPDAFLYIGKSYEALGLSEKAKWAFDRVK